MSVQRSQTSIKRGQTAGYLVQVSAKNGPASDVSVALTTQPASQKPTFSSGCTKGDGTATCSVGSMTAGQTVSLDAQVAVASNAASSVSSVKLTATAGVTTTATWTAPAAAETTAVTAGPPAPKNSKSPGSSASPSPGDSSIAVLPLGPIPALNGAASVYIGAGNAAGLFPAITPSAGASTSQAASAQAQPSNRKTAPVTDASPVSADTPVFTAQVAGLIALGLAIMLTVTRLSVRKRMSKPRSR